MADIRGLYEKIRNAGYQSGVIVEKLRVYNLDAGVREYRSFLSYLQEVVQTMLTDGGELAAEGISASADYIVGMMKGLLEAQEKKDYVLLADLLQLQVDPFLHTVLEQLRQSARESLPADYFEANLNALALRQPALAKRLRDYRMPENGEYFVEETTSGFPTCRVKRGDTELYLHSNCDPYAEARAWAGEMIDEETAGYHVLGCGLGYHGAEMHEALKGNYPVHIYEADLGMLYLAMHCTNMVAALREKLYLHLDSEWKELPEAVAKPGQKLCIHYPSLCLIRDERIRWAFERFFLQDSSYRNAKMLLHGNFAANMAIMVREPERFYPADELAGAIWGKTVYLVGAGPSLDKNIGQLSECVRRENAVLIACGTVFRKLLGMNIRPDYVAVTDANKRVLSQIRGVEQEDVPMLMLSTANHGFAAEYKAKHYIMFQEGYPWAEREAEKKGYMLFQTGGSVMTTALDAALRLGARKLVFVGLDLAFTDNLAHAKGTSNRIATDSGELRAVRAWGGGEVYADQKFVIYRTWMEKRLREDDAAAVKVINATEGGSYIEGMEHIPLARAADREA